MRYLRVVPTSRMNSLPAAASKRREVVMKLCRAGIVAALLVPAAIGTAGPPPPPGWQPAPPDAVYTPAPAVIVAPAPAVVYVPAAPPPPPLPMALKVVYAPFYVAALTIRYGLYYGIVVPLEVFGRTLAYGFEGGVADPEGNKEGQR